MVTAKEILWKLYDADQKIFFNDLNLAQLQAMINTIQKDKFDNWHVSKDGGEDWFPLNHLIKEIENKMAKSPDTDLEVLEVVGFDTFIKTVTGFQSAQANRLGKPKPAEKRKMKRKTKTLKALIDVGDQILEANTKDISILGLKLDKKFPLKFDGTNYPIVLRSKPPVELRCTPLVGERERMKGYWDRVKIHPGFNLNALVTLLEAD